MTTRSQTRAAAAAAAAASEAARVQRIAAIRRSPSPSQSSSSSYSPPAARVPPARLTAAARLQARLDETRQREIEEVARLESLPRALTARGRETQDIELRHARSLLHASEITRSAREFRASVGPGVAINAEELQTQLVREARERNLQLRGISVSINSSIRTNIAAATAARAAARASVPAERVARPARPARAARAARAPPGAVIDRINILVTLERNISNLYTLNDEFRRFLNTEQITYFTSSQPIQYYYRKRELLCDTYINKYQDIIQSIDQMYSATPFNRSDNTDIRDVLISNDIKRIKEIIEEEYVIMSNIANAKALLKRELVADINKELRILNPLNIYVRNTNFEPAIRQEITTFLNIIKGRIDTLNNIKKLQNLNLIIDLLEPRRELLIKKIESIKILTDTFRIAIISITRLPVTAANVAIYDNSVINIANRSLGLANISMESLREDNDIIIDTNINNQKLFKNNLMLSGFYTGLRYSPTGGNVTTLEELYSQTIRIRTDHARLLERRARSEQARVRREQRTQNARRVQSARSHGVNIYDAMDFIGTKHIEHNVESSCVGDFNDIGEMSSILVEKCKEYNQTLEKVEITSNFEILNGKFKKEFNTDEPLITIPGSITNYVGNSIASLYGRYLKNDGDIKFNDFARYFVVNKTLSEDERNNITDDRQTGIDAGGLRRDFVTSLTSELFDKKIFITREGTKKYFINPEFEPDNLFIYAARTLSGLPITKISFKNFSEQPYFEKFYKFIGTLLSFILVNECGIEHYLSSCIMANFIKKEFDNEDYVYFMKDDFPEFSTSLLNLMRTPDYIDDSYISYNDNYKLLPEDTDVKPNNINDYVKKLSNFMMTKTILRKDIELTKQTSETVANFELRCDEIVKKGEIAYNGLISGIPEKIKDTISDKLSLRTITSYLTAGNMNDEIIEKLKENFTRTMRDIISHHRAGSQHHTNLTLMSDLFKNNILTKPASMEPEDYIEFMTKLIRFWSGSTFYKENEKYKIEVNTGLSPAHLPQSHTCFFLIDLPLYLDGPTLFDKLNMAISNVEAGIGQAGGNKKRKYQRKSTSKPIAKKTITKKSKPVAKKSTRSKRVAKK